jgi:hypothetical protein
MYAGESMIHERLAKGVTALLIAAAATFAACGEDVPPDPKTNYCNRLCDCNKCTDEERGTCTDDITNLEDEALEKSCKEEFNTYITCLNGDASCTEGDYDTSVCFAEETDVTDCLKPPPPPCMTTNNGVCDEPEGMNTCAEGTDAMDCMLPPPCLTAGDGTCDEPEGTNTCVEGSDPVDCAPAPCAYTNDGDCDEPEGTGLCVEGSDVNDCAAPTCLGCGQYVSDPSAGTLCSASSTIYNNYYTCACGTCSSSCSGGVDICNGYGITTTCASCVQSLCASAFTACGNDLGD